MIWKRFIDFFRENYFSDKLQEFEDFLKSLEKPIPKTIRIKEDKVQKVISRLKNDGWILSETILKRVFSIERKKDFDPLERRLGMSMDHLIGNFYIQELAAAHPVDLLADGEKQKKPQLILDMASSPGGKSSQLVEYFPKSFIVANEPNRNRIPQLLQNLERMHTPNVGITLYSGGQWKYLPETFDKILLDAPCSGEWTAYKWTNALKFWHIKSIKKIANLQTKLVESALITLKTWWEMVYSTCSLNHLENEWVLEAMKEKYADAIDITFQKKFWPHIDKTGGFFMAKILKKAPIKGPSPRWLTSNTHIHHYSGSLKNWETGENISLYQYKNSLLAVKNAEIIKNILQHVYFMRLGENIGTIEKHIYTPNARAFRDIKTDHLPVYTLKDEHELDRYLRGYELEGDLPNWYACIEFENTKISIEKVNNTLFSNRFPTDWRRK